MWSWALLGRPLVMQPLDSLPAFYGTRMFITIFTIALHLYHFKPHIGNTFLCPGTSCKWTYLVWWLPCTQLLPEEPKDGWNSHGHTVPFSLLAWFWCASLHQGSAWVPQVRMITLTKHSKCGQISNCKRKIVWWFCKILMQWLIQCSGHSLPSLLC
jgi:hypothetical protein